MLQVKEKDTKNYPPTFGSLPIGEIFQDSQGLLNIKTEDDRVIFYENGSWVSDSFVYNERVFPINATITIEE